VKKIILIIFSFNLLFSDNCNLENNRYKEICNNIKKEVDIEYIKSYFNQKKKEIVDKNTLKLINKKYIKKHRLAEKKANRIMLSQKNINKIINHIEKYKDYYKYIENKYHVNKEIIAATLMKETRLGTYVPKHSSYITLNTMLNNKIDNKRQNRYRKMAKKSIESIIIFCYQNKIEVKKCDFKSSYTGAIGISQFMPFNLKLVEPYNNIFDLNNMYVAIASTANYYYKNNFKYINYKKIYNLNKIIDDWYVFVNKYKNTTFPINNNKKNTKSFVKLNEFNHNKYNLVYISNIIKNIMRYNNSSNYALGILNISYRVYKLEKR